MHIGNGDAVIGHGHALGQGHLVAVYHFLFIEHAGTTVHNQLILAQVRGEFGATGEAKFRLGFSILANPVGHLHGADILALAMMGAALADKNLIPVLNTIQRPHSLDCVIQATLVTGHEDGEGGEGHGGRHDLAYLGKGLTVGNDQAGRGSQL